MLGDLELDDHLVVALRLDRALDLGEEVALLGVASLIFCTLRRTAGKLRIVFALTSIASWSLSFSISLLPSNSMALMFGRSRTRKRRMTPRVLAGHVDLDVVEEAGVPERADVAREVLGLEDVAGLLAEVADDVSFATRRLPLMSMRMMGWPSAFSASLCGMLMTGPAACVLGCVGPASASVGVGDDGSAAPASAGRAAPPSRAGRGAPASTVGRGAPASVAARGAPPASTPCARATRGAAAIAARINSPVAMT